MMKERTLDSVKAGGRHKESGSETFGSGSHESPDQTRLSSCNEHCDNQTICEAIGCYAFSTSSVELKAGHHRTISFSLCENCVDKFVGDN
jgi:hypothetical protein